MDSVYWIKLKDIHPTIDELCDVTYDNIKYEIITVHCGWTWNGKCFEKNGDFLVGIEYWKPITHYWCEKDDRIRF